ncbi:RAD52 motif-containing protein 1 [Scleropages formosus]|uniref:RAD52 motif-containing protein 1 n=1 Tax=Scleropages formosus TaxID=113540 RepID=UPI0010FA7346|nr:RAD52 motif-containing protein 1 [Scleropages formosus]
MDTEVDVIEFRVPTENSKTLFIWDISAAFSAAHVYESLWSFFSRFGAIYWLKVSPHAAVARPAFSAVVKFYSAAQASRAQRGASEEPLFHKSPLKVRLCTKQYPADFHNIRPLSVTKCQQLANYYLGFNGWSSRVVTLKSICDNDDCGEPQTCTVLKYGCIVELNFPLHAVRCRGVGVTEETFEQNPGPEELCVKRGELQKRARDRAMVDAFRKVLLVVLGNGKVAVECRLDPEEMIPDEELEGLVKVNDISWSRFECEEEDDNFADLNLDFSHFS